MYEKISQAFYNSICQCFKYLLVVLFKSTKTVDFFFGYNTTYPFEYVHGQVLKVSAFLFFWYDNFDYEALVFL